MPENTNQTPRCNAPARAEAREDGRTMVVSVGGAWRLQDETPEVPAVVRAARRGPPERVEAVAGGLGAWDNSLVLFVVALRRWALAHGAAFSGERLPAAVRELAGAFDAAQEPPPAARRVLWTTRIGLATHRAAADGRAMLRFLGECVFGLGRVARRPMAFRWGDCVEQMRRCGAAALPVVGLISALVGVILSFVAAVQLRQFGADIFVANLVGLSVLREMGPMMAAIVLTGRTGAAFAAELGNMKLGEEIDALETFGVRAHDFLVMPRTVALVAMMPLLALYADFLGVAGGMFISQTMLDIAPAAFFTQLQSAVSASDVLTGLLKSVFFGFIVAYSGCFRGMQAERSSVGVGLATTSAVVMGILLIIVADALFTVLFNVLRW
jgi:phospholipid/cholesterol/gamma-HCH transport system permease protein